MFFALKEVEILTHCSRFPGTVKKGTRFTEYSSQNTEFIEEVHKLTAVYLDSAISLQCYTVYVVKWTAIL